MNKYLALLLLLLAGFSATAQRQTPQFGVLTEEEKSMTTYGAEPEAAIVVLFDLGDSYFFDSDNGYDIRFTRTKRMKVMTRAGVEMATVSIPFYEESASKKEKVVSIEAHTFILRDGLVYKKPLDPASIYEEQINNRVKAKKFAFPDVQVGAIIEYKYVLETPFHFRLPDWEFQSNLPTLYSEYTVSMIPFYEYIFVAQGITKFDYKNSEVSKKKRTWGTVTERLGVSNTQHGIIFNDMVHTFAMKNIPSFTDESYITTSEDYIMKMDFQLAKFNRPTGGSENIITTWPGLNKELQQHEFFGKYMNAATKGAKKILEKDLKLAPDVAEEKKIETIVSYVRTNYRWDSYTGLLASKSYKEFAEQRHGNIANVNLFLAGLLRAAEIKAEPVILSTRSNGKIKLDYPFAHYFNAVVVLVSGQRTLLVDGTEELLSYDRIPIRCINEKGLVVSEEDKESVRWIGLEPRVPSLEDISLTFNLDPEKVESQVTGQISATEYEGYEYKTSFNNDSASFKKYLKDRHQLEVSRVQFLSFDKPRLPYVMQFTGSVALEKVGNTLVVQPFLSFPPKSNPFTQLTRTYPVDYIFPRSTKMKSTIRIPAGYQVESLPQPDVTENELAQVKLNHTLNGSVLEIQTELILKKATYSSAEYSRLRNLYVMVVKGFNTPLVLKKA